MITKWVTPLFLSVLSFMVNTQNVCAVCKQGQEQSSSEAFQTNPNKTISNPSSNRSREIANSPIDSLEFLLSKWDTLLTEVQQQENASKEEFQLFSNFNRSYLDSEWSALFQLIKYRKVNYSNIASYLADKKHKLQSLYSNFVQIERDYPSSVEPFRHPSVVAPLPLGCNPACTNMDFATGNFTGWNGYYAANNSTPAAHVITGVTGGPLGAVVRGAKDPATSNTYQVHITSAGNNDWFLSNYHGINMSQASPWGTGYSAMIGDSINNGKGVAILSQEFQVTPTTNSITYAYSVFLENPAHNYFQQPFFSVVLFDQNGDTIQNCGVYNVVSGSNIPGFTGEYYPPDNHETSGGAGGDTIYWRPWTQVNVPLSNYVGQCVTIQFEVGDCGLGGHSGYAYVDASCSTFTITAASPVICGNGTDVLTGPSGESHYSWTGPSNSIITNDTLQNITIDSAGTYTLVITPVTGGLCKDTLTIFIPRDQLATTATAVNITCNGGTGKAIANASNGTAPYTYLWTPSAQTNATATGLSAGNYTVKVTDANGCAATASVTVSESPLLTVSATTTTNEICNGASTGSAIASIGGGLAPYLYIWNPTGQTNATATGLSAGIYTITVTDANGCNATASTAITQPTALTLSTSIIANVNCNGGSNGSANAIAGGGTGPYAYEWNPSAQTNATATGLSAGTYTVTVTDANGCTVTAIATITQPLQALSASTTITANVSCNGGSNGSANVLASGGTGPYAYTWNPSAQTNATATGLSAGTYTVTVTDANGCTATADATITQPIQALSASTTVITNVSCNGGSNGSANVLASGGTGPYAYTWNPSAQTNATATGLSAGTYTVTVTDANGCVATAIANITQPLQALSASTTITANVSCNGGSNGSANVTANGGTRPYAYIWNPSAQTNATATGLSAGTYTVAVTDANGCTATADATITQPLQVLSASTTITANVSCNGGSNGSANVIANGGTSPYAYTWNPSGQTNSMATGLSAGTYTVTVTDAHGCNTTATAIITQPLQALSTATTISTNVSCNGGNDGSASATANGGTGPYNYSWNPSGQNTATATGLDAGTYTVTATDAHGCTATASAVITQPMALTAGTSVISNVNCNGNATGSARVTAFGGTSPYNYVWNPSGQTNTTATGLSAGSYTVSVTDAHGCVAIQSVVITQPSVLAVSVNGTQKPLCEGQPATIDAAVSGGTLPYNYLWSNGSTTSSITVVPLITKTYTVTVTDANGCSETTTTTVIVAPFLVATGPSGSICPGQSKNLVVNPSGGDGQYTYTWLPGNNTNQLITVSPAKTTTYTIIVTDGCNATDTVYETLVVNPLPVVGFGADVTTGCAPMCVQFRNLTSISSGSISQWDWGFGDGSSENSQSPSHCYANPGNYSIVLTATSNNGCSASATRTDFINVYNAPVAAFTATPQPTTISNPVIQFNNQTANQDSIMRWLWNFGTTGDSNTSYITEPFHRYKDTGTYRVTLTVMNIHGCVDSVAHDVRIGPDFTLYFPNAFTPNSDGINDYFFAKGTYVKDFEMYIYDRWGQKIFHTTNINEGWDGRRAGGDMCQEDVYAYIATASDVSGNIYKYTGRVTLLK